MPEQTVVDRGSGCGAELLTYTSEHGSHHHVTPVEAPWQHGMVERHGQVLADAIRAFLK